MPPSHSVGQDAVATLIARHPLAWIVSRSFQAGSLPLIAERDAAGAVTALFGHCARANPLVDAFAGDPSGLVLFNGPAGYVSPRHVARADWAPTWNFATLRIEVAVEFVPDETAMAVERLLDHMEGVLPGRWSTQALGARHARLLSGIVAFRAHVRSVSPRFKLGQDEDDAVFRDIVDNLPDPELVAWMTAFAEGRAP